MRKRQTLLAVLPLIIGTAFFIAVGTVRRSEQSDGPRSPARRAVLPKPAPELDDPLAPPKFALANRPAPAPADRMDKAIYTTRIRDTYANFRTAVASGDVALRRALEAVLREDREAALRVAEEDLAQSRTPLDRDIAQKTVEALRK
jgi:hypothetical protein